jgi:hypothetical protein
MNGNAEMVNIGNKVAAFHPRILVLYLPGWNQ